MSVIGPNLKEDLYNALDKFLDNNDPDGMKEAYTFLSSFKEENELLFVNLLSEILGSDDSNPTHKNLAAIFIYRVLKKRTLEDQRNFIDLWHKQNFDFREQVRLAVYSAMTSATDNSHSYPSLLGLVFAIEFRTNSTRDPALAHFEEQLIAIFDSAQNSSDPGEQILCYNVLAYFSQYSIEFNPSCHRDQIFMRLVPSFFDCIISGMTNSGIAAVQETASQAMIQSLLVFKRHLSFPPNRALFLEVVFQYIQTDDVIETATGQETTYFTLGYNILRKVIDYFYPFIEDAFNQIFEQTSQDMQSEDQNRQIEACYLWLTIGEVESDIKFPDNRKYRRSRHHEFDQQYDFSSNAFQGLFPLLVQLIASTPEEDTQANVALDRTPQHAAFSCLSELAFAADNVALDPIFEFVMENIQEQDWTLRYTSALLLNAASQLPSFEANTENILRAFDLFIQCLDDEIPRIIEVAMWSLGRMIDNIPELITDPDRFNALTTSIAPKMSLSAELTSRGCWLYNKIFNVFSPGEEDSLIATNFGEFSTLLLAAGDIDQTDVDPLDAAYGALNKLIEKTPADLVVPYSAFLEQVVERLTVIISKPDQIDKYIMHKALGLCSFIQAIVMNIGPVIGPSAQTLINLLLQALQVSDGCLVSEVLPALGAVARTIGPDFVPYLEQLLPQLQDFLSQQDTVQYAAVFVIDIYSSITEFPEEITNTFVELLFKSFQIDDLSEEARVFAFSALTEIAKAIGPACLPWVEQFLDMFEKESRSALSIETDNIDEEYIKNFSIAILQCYQAIVPLFATLERGDRKVRNFFHIYDKLFRLLDYIDEEVLMEAIVLVKEIAETFGRKMNVYTHKPVVLQIIQKAIKSENETLQAEARSAQESIEAC